MPASTVQPGPGLDRQRLAALRRPHPATGDLPTRIRGHLDTHDGYLALSGGKDSVVVLHLALQADPNVPVVFFDSGLEFPETTTYLAMLADRWQLQLHRVPARRTALQVLTDSGTWDHHAPTGRVEDLHHVLITEPAARAHTAHGPGELWGLRSAESRGRRTAHAAALARETTRSCAGCCPPGDRAAARRHHGGVLRRADGTVAFSPIWDWTTDQVWTHLHRHDIPVNPLYERLRRVGAPPDAHRVSHVLDGAHLERGRVTWLRRGWPSLFEELAAALPRLREFV